MLYLVIVWSILSLICWGIGQAILNFCQVDCFKSRADQLLVSLWLGIVLVAVIFLVTALFVPLSLTTSLVVMALTFTLCLTSNQFRFKLASISPSVLRVWITLEFIVAFLMAQDILWIDSALYHLGVIRWLTEYGTVPGVALIHYRFGWTSAWFALIAGLNFPWFDYRATVVANGFLLILVLVHFFLGLRKILHKEARLADWFIFTAYFFLLPLLLTRNLPFTEEYNLFQALLRSTSHDIPVSLLIIIITWIILIILENQPSSSSKSFVDASLIPFILATAAVTIKLTSLPVFLVTLIFYLWSRKFWWQRLLSGTLLSLVLIAPMLIAGIITSGCPLLPSKFMCLELPWSLHSPYSIKIGLWWQSPDLLGWYWQYDHYWLSILPAWFAKSNINKIIGVSSILALSLLIWLIIFKRQKLRGIFWVFSIGLLGIILILTQAPETRYGLGYFLVIPCYIVGSLFYTITEQTQCSLFSSGKMLTIRQWFDRHTRWLSIFLASLILSLSLKAITEARFFLPPKLPKVEVVEKQVNDVQYFFPYQPNLCWATELPCSFGLLSLDVKLRQPEQGLEGGFIRSLSP